MATTLTTGTFEKETAQGLTLVDFWADWCTPCLMLAPIIEEIEKERTDLKVCKVNVDNEQALAQKFNVTNIPTIVLLQDGKEKTRHTGALPKAQLLEELGIS